MNVQRSGESMNSTRNGSGIVREIFDAFPLLETVCLPHTLLEGVLKEQIKGRKLFSSIINLAVGQGYG